MLEQVGQIFLSNNNRTPWQTQYSLGGEELYACTAIGADHYQLNTEVPFNPVAATNENEVYLWEAREGHRSIIVELLDGMRIVLKPRHQEHAFCFECHSGKILFTIRKTESQEHYPN